MVTPELRKFVADSIASNKSITEIRKELIAAKWNARDIHAVLKELPTIPVLAPSNDSPSSKMLPAPLIYTVLTALILVLSGTTYYFWKSKLDLSDSNNQKVREFYTRLAQAQISYTDAGDIIFPDEQKFATQKSSYIDEKMDFIEANLRTMELTLYEQGIPSTTVPILTKGKEKSWWETPTGNYKILTKSVNQFSSIGHVWMPYSMQFYGNYFIHGWPYYDDGTPVASTYSGGCIRLATEDAETVYNFTKVGTPILVLEEDVEHPLHTLVSKPTNAAFSGITTHSFLVTDLSSGNTLLERNSDESLPVHSLTKLMTAIVAHEILYLGRNHTVTSPMLASASNAFTPVVGDEYTGLDLLYPLLMQSSNETAEILAGPVGGKTFIQSMNAKSASLQMESTSFVDVKGESMENISTANDIAKLFQYVYYKRPFLFEISKGKAFANVGYITVGDTISITDLENKNLFVAEEDLIGVVHGTYEGEKQTLVTVWNITTEEKNIPIAIILLDSTNPERDTKTLYTWVTENFVVE